MREMLQRGVEELVYNISVSIVCATAAARETQFHLARRFDGCLACALEKLILLFLYESSEKIKPLHSRIKIMHTRL